MKLIKGLFGLAQHLQHGSQAGKNLLADASAW
jgi:hypothetical protein